MVLGGCRSFLLLVTTALAVQRKTVSVRFRAKGHNNCQVDLLPSIC